MNEPHDAKVQAPRADAGGYVRFPRGEDGALRAPDFTPPPAPPTRAAWRRLADRLSWWWTALLFAAAATGLAQAGFRLLGRHDTFLFVLGLLCLLAAVWAAFRAGFTIIKGLGT